MRGSAEPQREVASVLVIAADSNIEALLGELVAFAGFRPLYDVTQGAAGESIRRARPEIVLIDTGLFDVVVEACLGAAAEVASRPVLVSSTASDVELEAEAVAKGVPFFRLPGGPKPLASVLASTLAVPSRLRDIAVPGERRNHGNGSVHPSLCAALASLARTSLRARADDRRSHAALRAAVTDYAKQLRASDVPVDTGVSLVCDAIRDCATVVGAEAAVTTLLLETEDWAREAYRAR